MCYECGDDGVDSGGEGAHENREGGETQIDKCYRSG